MRATSEWWARLGAIGMGVVVLLGTAPPVRATETDGVATNEGVTCPAGFGAFRLVPDASRAASNEPMSPWLECHYRTGAGGAELHIFAAWDDTPPAAGGNWCTPPLGAGAAKRLMGENRSAFVSFDNGSAAPPEIVPAAKALLAQAAAHAVSCDGSATAASTTTTSVAPASDDAHKPLCPEATALLESFGPDKLKAAGISDPNQPTGLRVDGTELADDFQAAVAAYNAAHPNDNVYVSNGTPFAGEAGAVNWLFSYGGGVPGPQNRAYVTGNEKELQDRIITYAKEHPAGADPARLTPGQVFQLSLEVNGGHVNDALLTAHNLLRASARNDVAAADGILYDSGAFINKYLQPMRDGADNGGPWYHLFGTAYFEVVARGDWGPWLATGAAAAALASGVAAGGWLALPAVALAWQQSTPGSGTTAGSRFSNALEQLVREHGFRKREANAPDPEKFCVNVWGAQIGAKLYKSLPYKSTLSVRSFLSSFSSPPPESHQDSTEGLGDARYVNVMQSPFSVYWADGTRRMLFDQGDGLDARMIGGVPGFALPVPEEDSWGIAWVDPTTSGQSVSFAATRSGAVLHVTRIDTATGKTARYESTAGRTGQRFTMDLDPVTLAPTLTRDDGYEVVPTIVTLDLSAAATTSTRAEKASRRPPGNTSTAAIALGAAGVVAIAIFVGAIFRRRRRARSPA